MLTYIKKRLREKYTWVGIAAWVFYAMFHADIHFLIHSVLRAPQTIELIITSIPGMVSALVIFLKTK